MAWLKRSLKSISIVLLLVVGLLLPTLLHFPALSQPPSVSSLLPDDWQFSPPPGTGKPDNRQGGATRDDGCLYNKEDKLTALAPRHGALTAESYPSLFWYLPKTSAQELKVAVYNTSENRETYSTKLLLKHGADGYTKESQIMKLGLPDSLDWADVGLEIGKSYQWEVYMYCTSPDDPSLPFADQWATGYLERTTIAPEISRQIRQAKTAQERLSLYVKAGLWPETLETLYELNAAKGEDSDFINAWRKIINSIGLSQDIPPSLSS